MKIFLSFSGERSHAVAAAVAAWLRLVIHTVKPFLSSQIEKGNKWSDDIDEALKGTKYGIICLTPDNLKSAWIHYEAGALSNVEGAAICTFLVGLKPKDIELPLSRFQSTQAVRDDTHRLIRDINNRLAKEGEEPLDDHLLEYQFENAWPALEHSLRNAESIPLRTVQSKAIPQAETPRGERDVLDEILESVRNTERRLRESDLSVTPMQALPRDKPSHDVLRVIIPTAWPPSATRDFAIQLAVQIDALEWMMGRSEKTNTASIGLYLSTTWTAGEIEQRIKKALAAVGRDELIEWDLIHPSIGQKYALKS